MRNRAELDFIRDRVLVEIRANPPQGPLLGEPEVRPAATTCKRDHPLSVRANGRRWCPACRAADKREDRKQERENLAAQRLVSA